MTKPPWVTEIGFKQRINWHQLFNAYSATDMIGVLKDDMLSYILEVADQYVVFSQSHDVVQEMERLEARLYIVNDIEALRSDYHELEMYRREAQKGRLQDLKKENRDG